MLTQTNILVDAAGRSRIADFGLETSTSSLRSARRGPYDYAYLPRWKAPELVRGEANNKTTDVYSFAMVMVEVRAGGGIATACTRIVPCRCRCSPARFRSATLG